MPALGKGRTRTRARPGPVRRLLPAVRLAGGRARRAAISAVIVLPVIVAGTVLYDGEPVPGAIASATAGMGLVIGDVLVGNRHTTSLGDIRAAIGVTAGTPMLAVDIDAVRSRVEALPWVRRAVVFRSLGGRTLEVRLEEFPAAFLLVDGGRTVALTRDGRQIAPVDPSRYPGLLRVSGKGVERVAGLIGTVLDRHPGIRSRVAGAVWTGGRRWDLVLESGSRILLPERAYPRALEILADRERENPFLSLSGREIDMRTGNILLRRLPGFPPEREEGSGQKTGAGIT